MWKCLHLNIRSLSKTIDSLRDLLDRIKVDVNGLNETWLNGSVTDGEIGLSNFVCHRED